MPTRLPVRIGFLCGLLAAGVSGPALAQEGVAFKNLMSNMGILPAEKDPIRYRERAPLVVPPKTELRPPAASGLAAANPQWPNDPDVAARRRRTEGERQPVTWSEVRRMSGDNNRLTPDELARGRSAGGPGFIAGSARGGDTRDSVVLTPEQMRAGHRSADDETVVAGGAPARRTLADPPSAYRRSATGGQVKADFAPQVDQQALDANPMNWLRQQFSGSSDED